MTDILTLDYETKAITQRPEYPPEPVGVALRYPHGESEYIHWDHHDSDNALEEYTRAKTTIAQYQQQGCAILCHNGSFDMDVMETHMGLKMPPPLLIHDTMFLLYLYNPHAKELGLKRSAEEILDWPPEEQDAVEAWVRAHIPGITKKDNPWGAHICDAPASIVGPYAIGDVDRTWALFEYLMPYMERNSMLDAYATEQKLMPILLESERNGIRVDVAGLSESLADIDIAFVQADEEIHKILGRTFNINSGFELAEALQASDVCGELPLTPTGKVSTARKNLEGAVTHPRLLELLRYRSAAKTCTGTFMRPWMDLADNANGRLHTSWHQTRNPEGYGTRTGRVSSSKPNLTNVPNEFKAPAPQGYPDLPLLRKFLLPEEGHVWIKRDYSAQEIRILAHFEDGSLMRAFKENEGLDPHQFAMDVITEQTGFELSRKAVKIVAFSIMYGAGAKHISEQLAVAYHVAAMTKAQYLGAFPDVSTLMNDIKARGDANLAVRTLGGRLLFAEPPSAEGRRFSYKLLNHLIQGSAGDVCKQAMINYNARREYGQFQAQVYDELNVSVPIEHKPYEMNHLRRAMESVPCDVKLLTEGFVGNNWYEADKHD